MSRIDALSVAAVALAVGFLPAVHFPAADTAFAALIGAALAGGVVALGWRNARAARTSGSQRS